MQEQFGYDGEEGKNVVQNTGNAGYQLRALIYMTKCIATLEGNPPKVFFLTIPPPPVVTTYVTKRFGGKEEVVHKVLENSKQRV
jgi:hypothetical protein